MSDCKWFDFVCKGKEGLADMAGNAVAEFAEQVMIGVSNVLVSLGAAWINTPSINLESNAARKFITEHVQFLVLALLAGAIIMVGVRIVWTRRLEPLQDIMAGVFQFLVISLGGIKIMSMLIDASDEFSAWIIDQSVGSGEFATSLYSVLAISNTVLPGVGAIVLILGGIMALVANLIQIGLLFVRNALLILLGAVMVLPAAMPGSTMGKEWLKKLSGWFLAFLLFKPAASIIYATGITLVGKGGEVGGGDELVAFAMGLLFLLLAPIALPALMAFIVPSVSALSTGGGGGAAGMAMAAGSAATGAAKVASGGGGASGSESASHTSESASNTTNTATSTASGATNTASPGTDTAPSGGDAPAPTGGDSPAPTGGQIPAPSGGDTPAPSGGTLAGGAEVTTGGTAATGAAAGTGGASLAIQAGVEGVQAVTGAVQSTVDAETSGATGAGQTDE